MILSLLFCTPSFADDIVELSADGSAEAASSGGKNKAIEEALSKGALTAVTNLIGEEKVQKNLNLIRNKVLNDTDKFLPSYKPQESKKSGDNLIVTVTMKINLTSLQKILAQNGLYYDSEQTGILLPVIRIIEKREPQRSFAWWVEEPRNDNKGLAQDMERVVSHLSSAFRTRDFYVLDPVSQHYVQWIPDFLRVEFPAVPDAQALSEFFKAQMVLYGDIFLEPGRRSGSVVGALKWTVYNTSNGRVLAEISRRVELPSSDWESGVQLFFGQEIAKSAKDTSDQVFEEWSRGTFESVPVRLALKGSMTFMDIEEMKKQMTQKIREIRKLVERRMDSQGVEFEIDVSGGSSGLLKKLESTRFEGFGLQSFDQSEDGIAARWTKVR